MRACAVVPNPSFPEILETLKISSASGYLSHSSTLIPPVSSPTVEKFSDANYYAVVSKL